MVPIGVLTRNRVQYLDPTLKSLSATILPLDISVTVYDDASDDPLTLDYLCKSGQFSGPEHRAAFGTWPSHGTWRKLGLQVINDRPKRIARIGDKVFLHRFREPAGVVQASAWAIRDLMRRYPKAPGAILLQDDVVFNVDWYERLVGTATTHAFPQPLGVLAGIKINKSYAQPYPPVLPSGITAQCLYVTRRAYEKLSLFHDPQTQRTRFDDILKQRANRAGLWAGVILPFVCQHFGVQSLVRPGRGWNRGPQGRVGYCSRPPYVMAGEVRDFLRSS